MERGIFYGYYEKFAGKVNKRIGASEIPMPIAIIATEFPPWQLRGISLFLRSKDWGVIGEKKSKNGKKQAFLWVFCSFSGNFRGVATDSDSVIRC